MSRSRKPDREDGRRIYKFEIANFYQRERQLRWDLRDDSIVASEMLVVVHLAISDVSD